MPPKKGGGGGASKKTQEKVKNKTVEDKTFGLKNKNKSKKVGDYVKSVTSQVKGKNAMDLPPSYEDKQKKKEELERLRMEQDLFKPLIQQTKVPVGVDPKSVVCEFFKAGKCTKGDKCKFSHNLEVARKADKIDIYTDRREKEEDTMETWDQDKLEKVVDSKFVPKTEDAKKAEPKTQIVCKYFLEAIEAKKYGWFWECPNGGTKCMYQHKLPPGFILKSVAKEMEKDEDETPLEDILEEKRKLLTTRTPLTLETFLKWKEEKKKERESNKAADEKKKESEGRTTKSMRSGRQVFIYNPDLLTNDEEGEDVFDISELPTEEIDGPSIFIEATGTSIRTIVRGKGEDGDPEIGDEEEENIKEGKEEEVDDSLFREEDIPDEDDEDEDDS